jgi:hypothetical protein
MKLTQKAIEAINKTEIRLQLAMTLGYTEYWVIQLISRNKDNSPLTTAASLDVIRKNTGLQDADILEASGNSVAA